ncbi:MAG: ABC transporter permease [Thaumarchaeota archaeon]|jgi:peptide/nickel transport system permease protein|nr:ABC transporter permease [Candidatus Geocrenenecus arthurdayi]
MSKRYKEIASQLFRYRSAVFGIIILIILVGISIYTVITIPYDQATKLWRAGEQHWLDNPRNALPSWINMFLSKKLPETMIYTTENPGLGISKAAVSISDKFNIIKIRVSFDYKYDDFPSEINLFFKASYNKSPPQLTIYWIKPDGEEILLKSLLVGKEDRYYISSDLQLSNDLKNKVSSKLNKTITYDLPLTMVLFAVEDERLLNPETASVMKGTYQLVIDGFSDDLESDVDVKLVIYGKVYGWAGTDHLRRDLGLALLWGAPIALSFGVTAAFSIVMLQMLIGAVSAWFSGKLDTTLQRITEVFMILPFLPTIIMISMLYKITIWVLLLVVIGLSIFSIPVKNYRAMFLQVKEFPYIEAAQAYGASSLRIVLRYMLPRVLPTVIPYIVLSVPDFVFLEAALAILGLGDPLAPTWGKIIYDAYVNGALYKGLYYWVLAPSSMLIITSLSFATLGFALDKIFNPRLREI